MAFDYKKAYPEYYLPPKKPGLVEIPEMQFLAVRGAGDPNAENGAYHDAVGALYALSYTLKMCEKAGRRIEGFVPYVVPPLEGFWWQAGGAGIDYARKRDFQWISVIRLPDFISRDDFDWAVAEATRKKKADFSSVELLRYREGLCVQCLHLGPYDSEPATIRAMQEYAAAQGYRDDITPARHHHEIYLGDPRRTAPEKLKTVLRHPVKPV